LAYDSGVAGSDVHVELIRITPTWFQSTPPSVTPVPGRVARQGDIPGNPPVS